MQSYIHRIAEAAPEKTVLGGPRSGCPYKRVVILRKKNGYQAEQYTEKQVFHKNVPADGLAAALEEGLVSPVAGRAWRFAEQGPDEWFAWGAPASPADPSAPARLSSFCPLKRGTELLPELRHVQAGCGSHRAPTPAPSGSLWLGVGPP